jgi:hypothetical protein
VDIWLRVVLCCVVASVAVVASLNLLLDPPL